MRVASSLLLLLAACASATALAAEPACGGAGGGAERYVLRFEPSQREAVLQELRGRGYEVHSDGADFAAVSQQQQQQCSQGSKEEQQQQQQQQREPARRRRSLIEAAASAVVPSVLQRRRELRALGGVGGVASAERDVLRFLHRPVPSAGPDQQQQQQQKQQQFEQQPSGVLPSLALATRRVLRAVFSGGRLAGHWSGAARAPPASAYASWDLDQTACSLKDRALGDHAGAEVVPWGVHAVQGNSTVVPRRTAGTGVTVCVVDSGVWTGHPDLRANALSGCGPAASAADASASGGSAEACPFKWDGDVVAHGTHVAGTIGALSNGRGVVGVIPGGADIYSVRIWNTSGDVSQGQGVFASDLVRAYAACEARLDALKAQRPAQRQRMVVSMSFGSAGPLTVERLWFERAAKRGDMLFVASSGNNGSDWSSYFAPANAAQWKSYPASYGLPALLSVANANCNGGIADTSQRNDAVAIAAPGTSVLSSVPASYEYVRGSMAFDGATAAAAAAAAAVAAAAGGGSSGGRGATPKYVEPRPLQDADVSGTGTDRPVALCEAPAKAVPAGGAAAAAAAAWSKPPAPAAPSVFPVCKAAAGGGICLTGLPGARDIYEEACAAMVACIDGGGSALVLYRAADVDEAALAAVAAKGGGGGGGSKGSGGFSAPGGGAGAMGGAGVEPPSVSAGGGGGGGVWGSGASGGGDFDREILPGVRLNCGARCECWAELQRRAAAGKRLLPGVFIGRRQATDLLAAARRLGSSSPPSAARANVTVYRFPYRHYDGTSMAAPHVAGAAARVWVDFPGCDAGEVARALRESAAPLAGANAVQAGAGMLQVEAAYLKLKTYPCAAGRSGSVGSGGGGGGSVGNGGGRQQQG